MPTQHVSSITTQRITTTPLRLFSSSADISTQKEALNRIEGIRRELEVIMDQQQKRQQQNNVGMLQAMTGFLSRHKQELLNMFATFMCVILAYQIVGMRKGRDTVESRLESTRRAVEEKEGLLRALQEDDFVHKVASRVTDELDNTVSKSTSWWGQRSQDDPAAVIARVLRQELQARIGDAGLSEETKKEMRMKELQRLKMQQQGIEDQQLLQLTIGVLGDKPEPILQQVMQEAGENGTTVVTKRKIMM
jgi:hypothetical protein